MSKNDFCVSKKGFTGKKKEGCTNRYSLQDKQVNENALLLRSMERTVFCY